VLGTALRRQNHGPASTPFSVRASQSTSASSLLAPSRCRVAIGRRPGRCSWPCAKPGCAPPSFPTTPSSPPASAAASQTGEHTRALAYAPPGLCCRC
jgi:hypothetical protein